MEALPGAIMELIPFSTANLRRHSSQIAKQIA
jgi:hypothetical protein